MCTADTTRPCSGTERGDGGLNVAEVAKGAEVNNNQMLQKRLQPRHRLVVEFPVAAVKDDRLTCANQI
jgi:hypothetical protein